MLGRFIAAGYQYNPPKSWTLRANVSYLVSGQWEAIQLGPSPLLPGNRARFVLKASMNQGITDEGTPELGARMTDSKESNLTARSPSGEVLLTADEVAQILRVPRSWVYSHLSDLPVIRLGRYVRFRRSEINGFLEKRGACQ